MILIKSLIVLFLIILGYYLYDHFSFLDYFDGREGFEGAAQTPEPTEKESAPTETKYTVPPPAKKQEQMSDDAAMLSNLQDKMNELLKLKEEASEININLKK